MEDLLMVIDFHTHTFNEKIASKALHNMSLTSCTIPVTGGTVNELIDSMKLADVDYSVNLPVMTSPGQVEKMNSKYIDHFEELISHGIIPFGGLHPDYDDYKKEIKRLKENHIPGIKIHPAYQYTHINDIKMMRIIDCACEEGLIVLTHAGWDIGINDQDYCPVSEVIEVIDTLHPDRFILAHMGGWNDWDDFERDLAGAPVYIDTAFSIGKITPNPDSDRPPMRDMNLTDEELVRIIRKHGADKVLFATDSPWADQSDYIEHIKNAGLSDDEVNNILSGNALRILTLTG